MEKKIYKLKMRFIDWALIVFYSIFLLGICLLFYINGKIIISLLLFFGYIAYVFFYICYLLTYKIELDYENKEFKRSMLGHVKTIKIDDIKSFFIKEGLHGPIGNDIPLFPEANTPILYADIRHKYNNKEICESVSLEVSFEEGRKLFMEIKRINQKIMESNSPLCIEQITKRKAYLILSLIIIILIILTIEFLIF